MYIAEAIKETRRVALPDYPNYFARIDVDEPHEGGIFLWKIVDPSISMHCDEKPPKHFVRGIEILRDDWGPFLKCWPLEPPSTSQALEDFREAEGI